MTARLGGAATSLGEEIGDGFGFDQLARLFEVIEHDRFGGNPESMINRGQQFHGVDRIFGRAAASLVRFSVDVTASGSSARDD